ncbi:MAG: ribose transport system permease protein [Verrucomicrobia bacterium]|nr:MAG: ribose transport system permease protein [Verrucomicrobiota bacterium]
MNATHPLLSRLPGGLRAQIPILSAMVGLLLLFGIWVPNFLAPENLIDIAQQNCVYAILAFGMTLVILIGGIDLSVGALVALVGTVTTFTLVQGWAAPLALLSGFLVAASFGLFHGLAIAKGRMPAFIATLASMMVARGLAFGFNSGRPMSLPDEQTAILALGNGRVAGFLPIPVIIMLALYGIMAALLHFTVFGRHLYAIGNSRAAAEFSGVRVQRREIASYLGAAILTAFAGLVHASQLYGAEPASGQGFELNAIAAAVVGGASLKGGRGSMTGTLFGAIIIGILDKGLNQAHVHFSLQYIIKGSVILASVWLDTRRRD